MFRLPDRHFARHGFTGLALLAAWFCVGGCAAPSPSARQGLFIHNPYADVDWARAHRCKANFHTHTTGSDGSITPHDVIDRYHALGYSILAITDHNVVTWPWNRLSTNEPSKGARAQFDAGKLESPELAYQDRDPAALGMVAILGCELSSHHHTGSFFNDHSGSKTEEESLAIVTAKDGIAMLYHPGRYKQPVDWYVDLYRKYPILFGLEVFNQGNRYPDDRKTWDAILSRLMPDRPVWGYSNDDMHRQSHLGRNWNILLLDELSADSVRRGMVKGHSYFVYSPAGHRGPNPPVIESITLDPQSGVLRIQATGHTNIAWFSEHGLIHQGDTLQLADLDRIGSYVRAQLSGVSNTVAGTQPFGIIRPLRSRMEMDIRPGRIAYVEPGRVRATLVARNTSTDDATDATLVVRLNADTLLRRTVSIMAGAETNLDLAIPVAALNTDGHVEVEWDLGPAYGRFHKIHTRHPIPSAALPVELTAQLPSIHSARVSARNTLAGESVTFNLLVSLQGAPRLEEQVTLAAGQTIERSIPLPEGSLGGDVELQAEARFAPLVAPIPARLTARFDLRHEAGVPRLTKPVTVDGNLAEWPQPNWVLNRAEHVFPTGRRERWSDTNDLSVTISWGWDGEALCLAAEVKDDRHHNTRSGDNLWDGDSLQMAVVPEGPDAVNWGFALTPDGVKFNQWQGKSLAVDIKTSFAVVRHEDRGTTIYEMRVPLSDLGVEAAGGARFGFGAVCFDDDSGQGYDCWMHTAPGMAGGWAPETLPRFFLAP